MAPPDDDNVGGGQGGAAGNAGGNGGNAVVDGLKSLELGGLCSFDPKGDPTTLCARWKRWKRAFNLYVKSRGVSDEGQKVAMMLHTGGMALQEVYYSLAEEDADLSLAESIKVLDEHFIPMANVPFEQHLFRQLEQQVDETVDQFVCRLRQKSLSCDFAKVDEAIRDQLIEKCRDARLRRKFLEKAGNAKLKEMQDIARAYEAVEAQMRSMSATAPAAQVNAVHGKDGPAKENKWAKGSKGGKLKSGGFQDRRCYNCNRRDHLASDRQCPARGKTCRKCGDTGHFEVRCTKSENGRPKQQGWKGQAQSKRAYNVEDSSGNSEPEERQHAFHVGTGSSNGIVDLKVGGVDLKSVLIDSGASCNLMDKATWEELKAQNVDAVSRKSGKKLFAYGQTEPIEVLGTFDANITCDVTGVSCEDQFTVIKGKGTTLLSKGTAEKLNVLRVGPVRPGVYSITSEGTDADVREQFPEVFSGIGKLADFQLKLHVNRDVKPVAQPVRRLPFGLRDKVDEKLDELLEKDIIEEVSGRPTEWVSPLVVVPKSDGDIRICVDMRRANEAIVRERHPIPTIEEVLYDLNGSTVFSKLDLKWGFHQIELEAESREITTFVTHRGLFRYKRLMFGIASAPEKYQKIVKDSLSGCEGVANIADDLIVHGKGVKEHDEHLYAVLNRIRECGLTLNGKKCQFRLPKLTFFGHDLSRSGVQPSEEKVAAIRNAEPQNPSEVRSFLGLVQYSSKFLPDFAEVAEPLRKLTRTDKRFVWGTAQRDSFAKLKELISRAETLAYFQQDSMTRIVADAGPSGLGAVLVQLQGDSWRVIAYASRNLTDVERRYSQTEKEALALVWACERFNLYVFGREFELETDHKPLECIYGKTSKPSARIERWVLRLQGYDYNVVYRPGKANIADALSRLNQTTPCDVSGDKIDFVKMVALESTPSALSAKQVELASEKDPELISVRQYVTTGDWSKCKLPHYLGVKDELCVLGYLVLRGDRLVIPQSMRDDVLRLAHEGHQGIVKTKNRLRAKVWWPKMDAAAEKLCRSCHGCQVVGELCAPEPMQRVEPPTGPWQDVALDLMGPLPTGESLLVVVDYYSRFYEVGILRSTTVDKVIDFLGPVFTRYGYPFSVKSDNGPQFVSQVFKDFLVEHGIEHRTSPPLWPQANGEVERQNRTLLKALKVAQVEGKRWQDELQKFLLAYRSTPQANTGATPAFLMFGREIRTKLPELRRDKVVLNEEIRDRDWRNKVSQKVYADAKRGAKENDIVPGDQVLLKNTKATGKLAPNFESEPYTVKAKEGHELTLQSKDGNEYRRNSSFVKPYQPVQGSTTPEQDIMPDAASDPPASPPRVAAPTPPRAHPTPQPSRPSRSVKPPARFDDYVLK